MAKKQRNKKLNHKTVSTNQEPVISERIEQKFNLLLKIMSWIIGISFVSIVIIPSFNFPYIDILVKIIFFLGIFNLLLFAFIEMFGTTIKRMFNKLI